MKKAYAVLNVKDISTNKDFVTVTGIASTPTTDRDGDIVRPEGAKFTSPMPFLWQHRHDLPVGQMTIAKPGKNGIPFTAKIPIIKEAGKLKDRIDEVIHSLKYKLVGAVSIGFRAIKHEIIDQTGGWDIKEWEWMELSLVTIPANPEAIITGVKSIDDDLRAALGKSKTQTKFKPGVSGNSNSGERKGMNIYEQLRKAKQDRAEKAARLAEIREGVKEEKRSYSADENDEIQELLAEVKQLDNDINDLEIQVVEAGTAKAAIGTSTKRASYSRGIEINMNKFKEQDEEFQGQHYTRIVIAKALAHINQVSPVAIAKNRWGHKNPLLVEVIKAAVEGGGSGSGEWGAELVSADNRYTGDFIEYLKQKTLYDKLPLRPIPANVTIKGQDGTSTGYWVGESKAITPSTGDFSSVSLTPLKVAALAVLSNELLRDSSPSAEMLVRDNLADASAQRIDTTFISATAASAGVSPAGMLNGVSGQSASGVDGDALRADIKTLYDIFIAAFNASGLVWALNPGLAKAISLMTNTLGVKEFPGITQNGGTLEADPVFTSDNVNAAHFILMKPSDIYKIGESGVEVSISREATIEMNDAPAMDSQAGTAASGNLVNMFQTESTAIKIVRPINFAKRRSGSVQYVSDAAYGTVAS